MSAAPHPLPKPNFVHLADIVERPSVLVSWERTRHRQAHWLMECVAEFTGVFLYVFAGCGSQAAYVLGSLAELPLSSVLQIGFAYAIGIVLALICCSGTSGGHFNPAVTISFVIFKKFPPLKALRYIVAQILGGYIACLIVYAQYHHLISEVTAGLQASGHYDALMFTPSGPGGIFGFYITPGSPLGLVFLNEFVADFVLGLVIFTCLDPTNFFLPPPVVPWVIAMTYACVIWSYSPNSLATNAAREVGGRLAAVSIWGSAASGGSYAAIASLTNIPATLLAYIFYHIFFADSSRVVIPANVEFLAGHQAHEEHQHTYKYNKRVAGEHSPYAESHDGKGTVETIERA